jgi:hypothetical protein
VGNHRIINGKDTVERLTEEFQRLCEADIPVTVVEFARRAGISYHTLTHRYRDWAEKVRGFRDQEKSKPRMHSPATRRKEHIVEFEEAEELITELRRRINYLTTQLEGATKERDKWKKRAIHLEGVEETNERLRGIVVSFQQEIRRYWNPEQGRRMLQMIEEYASSKAISPE